MMVSIVNIPTALVFVVSLAALFYFKSKFVIPLVVAGAALAGYLLSFVAL
jgi:chromate transporter